MEEEEDPQEKLLELGRGNRAKKETNYDDQMSEREWLKAIGAEEEEMDDDDEDEAPKKRGRGGKKKDDSDDDDEAMLGGRGRGRKKKKGSMKKLQKKMRKLMEVVVKYEDQDGRILSEPFMKLPSKRELPDYYEIIRKPVDISKMLGKIADERYEDLDALQKDFLLLCKNTQTYNEDGSLIYEDSIVLESVFRSARERLEADSSASSVTGGADGDESNMSFPSTSGQGAGDVSVASAAAVDLNETGETVDSGASGSRASSVAGDGVGGGSRGRKRKGEGKSKSGGRKRKSAKYALSDDEDQFDDDGE